MSRRSSGPALPREAGAAPLEVVIGVMAFLAALALGASVVADRAAQSWRAGLSGRMTVQILPPERGSAGPTLSAELNAAVAVLRATPGVIRAEPLPETETEKLVEPWLGSDAAAALPLPRLVDVMVLPGAKLDLHALSTALARAAPDSILDDHSHWITRLSALADAVEWGGYGILALIAVATASIVAFATRAGLEAHHDIVAMLHQMGAHSGFIAGAFERHYLVSAFAAAAVGAGCAAVLFIAAGGLEIAGIEAAPLLPPLMLQPWELVWLSAVPLGAGVIAWATARISVLAALRRIY